MPNYDDIEILPGMQGQYMGDFFRVISISEDNVVTAVMMDTQTTVEYPLETIKGLASTGELWVAWPPNFRQENMP